MREHYGYRLLNGDILMDIGCMILAGGKSSRMGTVRWGEEFFQVSWGASLGAVKKRIRITDGLGGFTRPIVMQ